jgi:hypothetical protein
MVSKTTKFAFALLICFFCVGYAQAQKDKFAGTWLLRGTQVYQKFIYQNNDGLMSQYLMQLIKNSEVASEVIVKVAQNGSSYAYKEGKVVQSWIMSIDINVMSVSSDKGTKYFDKVPDIVVTPSYSKGTITHVVIDKIAPTKPSGGAWDTYMGNYKPDVYAIIKSPAGNEIWRSPYRHDDLSNERCPVEWSLSNVGGIEIKKEYFHENYKFELWDMDSTTLHDHMISGSFSFSGYEGGDLIFNGDGFKITFKVRWE